MDGELAKGVGLAGLVALALVAGGCGNGDHNPVPPASEVGSAHFQLLATSSFGTSPKQLQFDDPTGTVYMLTSARLAVEKITLKLPSTLNCRDVDSQIKGIVACTDGEVFIDQPFVVDLRSGQTTPDLSDLVVPAVDYEQMTVEVNEIRATDGVLPITDPLIDRTLIARADFQFEGTKLELGLNFRFHQTMRGQLPRPVADGSTITFQFDIANWLVNIPVTSCVMDGDIVPKNGLVVVNGNQFSGQCSDADSTFETNFENSFDVTD